jgi:hypothetical protein
MQVKILKFNLLCVINVFAMYYIHILWHIRAIPTYTVYQLYEKTLRTGMVCTSVNDPLPLMSILQGSIIL